MATPLRNITNQQILEFLVMLGGCLFAMYAGNYIAEENYVPIAAVLGMLVVGSFFFKMGTNMYLMIPICWGLTGSISLLPLPFNVRQLMILLATVLFVAGYIFKVGKQYRARFEMIDLWIWINLGYLFTAFLRNPVGFAAIGGGARVGGKPYLDVFIGVAAYLMLTRFRILPSFARRLPLLMLCVAMFTTFAGGLAFFFPGVSNVLGHIYSDFATIGEFEVGAINVGETRFGFLLVLGLSLPLYVVCRVNPIKLIAPTNFWWLVLYLSGVVMVLASGFRNGIIGILLSTTVAAMIYEKEAGVFKIVVTALVTALFGVLISYTSIRLPYTFQRALCFLPGNWDQEPLHDAKGSSEWRFELWRLALTSNRYISSKVFGDGFGFSREEYDHLYQAMISGKQAFEGENAGQEAFLIDGDFHSGPVGTIRFVGYVGLALFLPLLIMQAFYSYRVINAARGTPYELLAMYLGIPSMILPFVFIFLFGDFRIDFVTVLFNVGMMKMIRFSIKDRDAADFTQYLTDDQHSNVEKVSILPSPMHGR